MQSVCQFVMDKVITNCFDLEFSLPIPRSYQL